MPDKVFQGYCPACTNVCITETALSMVKTAGRGHLLSAALRRLPVEGWNSLRVVTINNLHEIISAVRELSVLEQFDESLRLICDLCPVVGKPSNYKYEEEWPLLTAKGPDTGLYILSQMANMGYLEKDGPINPFIPPRPTWKAYQRLQEIQSSGPRSQNAFVAMWFDQSRTPVWASAIEPAIRDAGYKAIRVDQYEHNNWIDDEIMAQIRRCRFLVADFTGQRAAVYFEAGFAQGLGREVICMCDKSEQDKVSFDTRQINHIFYDDLQQARVALTNRIVRVEGEGELAKEETRVG